MTGKPRIHRAAMALPRMSDEEFAALVSDIKERGLLVPIELLDGQVIDGRHRLEACELAEVEPRFVDVEFDGISPGEYVWSLNGVRRHLTASQRACVAVELLPELEEKAKERMVAGGGDKKSQAAKSGKAKMPSPIEQKQQSRDAAAAMVNVSGRLVSDAKAIKQAAPELFQAVKEGGRKGPKVSQAKVELQRQAKRERQAAKAEEVAELEQPSDWRIIHGDCVDELADISGARLIFADPPYNIGIDYGQGKNADLLPADKYRSWCQEWLGRCADGLADDGSLWVMVPDEWAAEIAVILNKLGLHRRAWIKWYETFGVNCSRNFNRTSRHIFYCVVDPKHFVFNEDAVTRPSDRQTKYADKRAAAGGKIWDDVWTIPRLVGTSKERLPDFPTQLPLELLTAIVGCASEPGDLVVDPFCGSATTGVAAKQLGRKFIGIEKEERFWERGTVRLATTSR